MSRFEQDIEVGLRQIADRATPSPDAWNSILTRIADQEPIHETEIIMLTDNTIRTKRWPLYAAAAAVVALVVGGLALIARDDGAEVPADTPPPTVAPTSVAPAPDTTAAPLPGEGQVLSPGRYTSTTPGVSVTFLLDDGQTAPWTVQSNQEPGGIQLWSDDTAREFIAIGRVGSWYDADQARAEETTGLGSIAADDIDGWIKLNGINVVDSADVEVGGRSAKYRQIQLDTGPDGTGDFCPAGERPCLWAASGSADTIDANPGPIPFSRERLHSIWLIDMDEFEPMVILAIPNLPDEQAWFENIVQPIVDSMEIGAPAPIVEGGTARLPERIALTADMTVNQTGERDINEPWPIERTGPIVGDINGTFTGTGMSSPNGAEVTLDWVMDVTIDGLGTGTLTLRSDEVWTGDGATTATDRVIAGTGDFDGVTGFGMTTHTDDGAVFTATIELTLVRPTN